MYEPDCRERMKAVSKRIRLFSKAWDSEEAKAREGVFISMLCADAVFPCTLHDNVVDRYYCCSLSLLGPCSDHWGLCDSCFLLSLRHFEDEALLAPCVSSFPMERAVPAQATVVDQSTCLPESSAKPRCMPVTSAAGWLTGTARFGCRHIDDAREQLKNFRKQICTDDTMPAEITHH